MPLRAARRSLLLTTLAAAIALAGLASMPAAASVSDNDGLGALVAGGQLSDNDDFFNAWPLNFPGDPLESFSELHDNVGATTQGGEFTQCGTVFYGATVWYWFFPHVDGRARVTVFTSGGFTDPVAAIITWTGDGDPDTPDDILVEGLCNGPILGLNRTDVPAGDNFTEVFAGQQYAIQIGGARTPNNASGIPDEGDYEVFFTYDPDSDGDGVFDSEDQCPNQAGLSTLGGCPDRDGDGVRDLDDDCPDQGGPAGFRGCPDTDGDGIRDRDDDCAGSPGPAGFRGCPDSDGDGIRDPDDDCDNQPGPAGFRGCADSDGDGLRDPDDRCPTLNALRPASGITRSDAKPRDGCPDTALLHRLVGTGQDVGGTPRGILLRSFVVKGVLPGTRVLVVCRLPNGKRCGGVLVRRATTSSNVRAKAARRISVKSLKNKRLPFGSKIVVRATAPYATGKYVRLTVVRTASRVTLVEGCMNPGSNRVRRRGCG